MPSNVRRWSFQGRPRRRPPGINGSITDHKSSETTSVRVTQPASRTTPFTLSRHALVDEIDLQVNPVILGAGERLFDGFDAGKPALELVRVREAPGVAHLRYRVVR